MHVSSSNSEKPLKGNGQLDLKLPKLNQVLMINGIRYKYSRRSSLIIKSNYFIFINLLSYSPGLISVIGFVTPWRAGGAEVEIFKGLLFLPKSMTFNEVGLVFYLYVQVIVSAVFCYFASDVGHNA